MLLYYESNRKFCYLFLKIRRVNNIKKHISIMIFFACSLNKHCHVAEISLYQQEFRLLPPGVSSVNPAGFFSTALPFAVYSLQFRLP